MEEKKHLFEKIYHNKRMQILFFAITMAMILVGYLLMSIWVKEEKIRNKPVGFDSQIVSHIENVFLDNGRLSFLGWALRIDSEIDDIKVVLEATDDSAMCILETTSTSSKELDAYIKYLKLNELYNKDGFVATLDESELNSEICYEVLLYLTYTYEGKMQAGEKEIREVKKISTTQYLYKGELYTYNPLEFNTPNFQNTSMVEVIEKGMLCAYDIKNGVWIYLCEGSLYWILDTNVVKNQEENIQMFFHLVTSRTELLPEHRIQYGFDYKDFNFQSAELELGESRYRVAQITLSVDYPIVYVSTGHYDNGKQLWILRFRIPNY